MVLEKTLESPLDCKEIQPVHSKGSQSWIFIGRTDVEAKTLIPWPPDAKNWLIWKDPDAGKDWRQEEKGTTNDEMVGWHHQFDGHEFEYTLGVGDGQGGLACCSPGGCKESDMTEQLNWTELTEFSKVVAPIYTWSFFFFLIHLYVVFLHIDCLMPSRRSSPWAESLLLILLLIADFKHPGQHQTHFTPWKLLISLLCSFLPQILL